MSESNPPESGDALPPPVSPVAIPQEKPKTLEDVIKEKAPEVLKAIPPEQMPTLKRVTFEQQISYRSGMLPEPSELAAYNEIIPDGANRIMKMVEMQSSHRIALESAVVQSQQKQETRGQWFGLIISIFFGACGLYAALNGQPWFGGIITGTTLVSLVGIFVYSKKQSQKDLSDKRKSMPVPTPAAQLQAPNQKSGKNRRRR